MRRPPVSFALSLTVLALAACEKTTTPVELPTPEPEPPAALIAMVELPSGTDFSRLADAVGQIAPEARSTIAAAAPMQIGKLLGEVAGPVDAIELEGPMRLLVVVSEAEPREIELVFVVRSSTKLAAADGYALTRLGEDALIGAPAAVDVVTGHAAHLVTQPIAEMSATAFPGNLLAAYDDKLDALPAMFAAETGPSPVDLAELMKLYIDLGRALGQGAERVVATLESEDGAAHLVLRTHARPESTLAAFIADQKPSAFALHQHLPAGVDSFMFFEVSLRASVALEPMVRMSEAIFSSAPDPEAVGASIRRYADILTGDSAMLMSMKVDPSQAMPTAEGVGIYGVTDARVALDTFQELLKLWSGTTALMNVEQTIRVEDEQVEDGVAVVPMTTTMTVPDPAGAAPQVIETHSAIGAGGKLMTYAMGEGSTELARGVLVQQKSGETGFVPSGVLERALDRARRNQDSMLVFIDLGGIMPPGTPVPLGMSMTLGFKDRVATFTMSAMK